MSQIKQIIRRNSIDNLRVGKIISKTGSRYLVRIGIAEMVCYFSGTANIGDVVALECLDGVDNKSYVLDTSPVIIAEGGNVII